MRVYGVAADRVSSTLPELRPVVHNMQFILHDFLSHAGPRLTFEPRLNSRST